MNDTSFTPHATQDLFLSISCGEEIILFDTETTGLKAETERIIELAANKLLWNGEKLNVTDKLHLYINPGFPLPAKIVELTGITDEKLADKKTEDEVFDQIFAFFGETANIAAYNSPFDIKFLCAMYERQGKNFTGGKEYDVLAAARDIVTKQESKSHKLGDIARLYGADKGLTFHSAEDDVTATFRLFQLFITEYAEKEKVVSSGVVPKIYRINFWEGFKGYSRLYVTASTGRFYYDIRNNRWGIKEEKVKTNMNALIVECMKFSNANNYSELVKNNKPKAELEEDIKAV